MVIHEAIRVLVMVNHEETCNMPSAGSSTLGVETARKLGALTWNMAEPIGPIRNPAIVSARTTMPSQTMVFVKQPHPILVSYFSSLSFFSCSFCSI